jgi:hypothetical protein
MAKSKKQKIAMAKKTILEDLWKALEKDVNEMSSIEDCYNFDFDNLRHSMQGSETLIEAAFEQTVEKYAGTLEVTAKDRQKILDEVENSCLAETTKLSFKKLLKSDD